MSTQPQPGTYLLLYGDYLSEEDIVRHQDKYGRAKTAVRVDGAVERSLTFGFVALAAL
jgi:hypothetical protein